MHPAGGPAWQNIVLQTEFNKEYSAFVWFHKRKMLDSYARTNEFHNGVFLDFIHFEIFQAPLCCQIIDFSRNSRNFFEFELHGEHYEMHWYGIQTGVFDH